MFVAPTAWHKLFHSGGEYATCRAVDAYDRDGMSFMIASSFSQTPLEHLYCKKWYQMMVIRQEEVMKKVAEEAKEKNVKALVLTIDAPNGCTACRTA